MHRLHRFVIFLILPILIAACGNAAAPSVQSEPTVEITINSHVGSRIIVNGQALTVERFERQGSTLTADVTIENVDAPSAPYSSQFFLVRDAKGNTYPAAVETTTIDQIAKGEQIQRKVSFGVGEAQDLTLEFRTPLFENTAPIRVLLR